MIRKIQESGDRKSASEIAALVDEGARLDSSIREAEQAQRELRNKLKQAGRSDLVRKYLEAPVELRDLAGRLWRNKAPVTVLKEKDDSDADSKPFSAADFPNRLVELIRADRPLRKFTTLSKGRWQVKLWNEDSAILTLPPIEPLIKMRLRKLFAHFTERLNAAKRRNKTLDQEQWLRQFVFECWWWWFSLEEWTCVFPDAAQAGDRDFIKQIVKRFEKAPPELMSDPDIKSIGYVWHGFYVYGVSNIVPPLKHWSDKAGCEWVRYITSDENLSLGAYKLRKSRLGLHSEKPTLVSSAAYTRAGDIHRLTCKR